MTTKRPPKKPPYDDDIAQAMQPVERLPATIIVTALIGAAFSIAVDFLYDHHLSAVAWIAVTAIWTVTIPISRMVKAQRLIYRVWANGEQASRALPPQQPTQPPNQPPRQRSQRTNKIPTANNARLRLTPPPQDLPKEVSR